MKTRLIIIVLAVVLAVTGGTVAVVKTVNSPKNVAARALSDVTSDLEKREELSVLIDVFSNGSIEFSLKNLKNDAGEDLLKNGSVSGKLYFSNKNDAVMLSDLKTDIFGDTLEGSAYVSRDKVYVYEKNVLGEAYGAEISSLKKDFKNSIFSGKSKSAYAVSAKQHNEIVSAINKYEKLADFKDDLGQLYEKIAKDVWEIIKDDAEISSESASVRVGEEKTKARKITISADSGALEELIEDLYYYFKNSEEIVEFLDEYDNEEVSLLEGFYDSYDSASAAYEDWFRLNGIKSIKALFNDTEELSVEIITPKMSSKLLKLTVDIDDETLISADFGKKGIAKTDKISIALAGTTLTYDIKKDTKNAFEANLNLGYSGTEHQLKVEIDRNSGEYTATYNKISGRITSECTISGEISKEKGAIKLGIDSIDRYELDLELKIKKKDKMPTPLKDFKSIDEIKEKDVDSWSAKLEKLFK